MLSVIIPARNETYLKKTIDNVLENARGEIEVIAVCDGYKPDPPIKDDPRIITIYHPEAIGQRQAINEAARIAKGKYIMKLDAHCAVDKGFDVKLAADCEYDWTVVPRMYNLDITSWKPKLHKRTDYMYISSPDDPEKPFRAQYYGGSEFKAQHAKKEEIDDTMCCMGPGWFMHKDRFWELDGCDEGHGGWGQQGIEVALKAWLSGGSLKVNKKTWFSHWFRGGSGPGFPYKASGKEHEAARAYSRDLWLNNKWPKQTRNIDWLVKKFNPPGWKNPEWDEVASSMYRHIHRMGNHPKYKGVPIQKFPTDIQLYHQAIHEKQPEIIIEIGTRYGGSALFFADQGPKVVTIDIKDQVKEKDPRITYIFKNSLEKDVIEQVKKLTEGKKTMLVIDGNHQRVHVKWELHRYWPIVTPDQYMVVEDCYIDRGLYGPGEARDWFLKSNKHFEKTNFHEQFLWGVTNGGWLLRK